MPTVQCFNKASYRTQGKSKNQIEVLGQDTRLHTTARLKQLQSFLQILLLPVVVGVLAPTLLAQARHLLAASVVPSPCALQTPGKGQPLTTSDNQVPWQRIAQQRHHRFPILIQATGCKEFKLSYNGWNGASLALEILTVPGTSPKFWRKQSQKLLQRLSGSRSTKLDLGVKA